MEKLQHSSSHLHPASRFNLGFTMSFKDTSAHQPRGTQDLHITIVTTQLPELFFVRCDYVWLHGNQEGGKTMKLSRN